MQEGWTGAAALIAGGAGLAAAGAAGLGFTMLRRRRAEGSPDTMSSTLTPRTRRDRDDDPGGVGHGRPGRLR